MTIEGLKVTVSGSELKEMCIKRAEHHHERYLAYVEQIQSMEANRIEGMNYTNGDPIQTLTGRKVQHQSERDEMYFISKHLLMTEDYLLAREDLVKLGVMTSKY